MKRYLLAVLLAGCTASPDVVASDKEVASLSVRAEGAQLVLEATTTLYVDECAPIDRGSWCTVVRDGDLLTVSYEVAWDRSGIATCSREAKYLAQSCTTALDAGTYRVRFGDGRATLDTSASDHVTLRTDE